MVRENKRNEIKEWCEQHSINLIKMYQSARKNKSDIKVSLFCNSCGNRYDMMWTNLKRQDYPGLCTYCAHKKSQDSRRIGVEKLIKLFNKYGYDVVTSPDKIKPVGKRHSYIQTRVMIQNSKGDYFTVCWNDFQRDLQKYISLNGNGYESVGTRKPSKYEQKVIDLLEDYKLTYKREFKISGCRGDKRMLPFDFCIDYKSDKIALIEVDGERHFKDGFEQIKKYDKIKNYYCETNNIPLLRVPYWDFYNDDYKTKILDFINTYSSSDTI